LPQVVVTDSRTLNYARLFKKDQFGLIGGGVNQALNPRCKA
jgi:hypothetical protein